MSSKRRALLHWGSSTKPCFCNPEIYLDLDKLEPSAETIGAIFGVRNPESISLVARDTSETVPIQELQEGDRATYFGWKLEADAHYDVRTSEEVETVVPIHGMFQLFPGANEDEKSERIHKLSLNFYGKIWNDPATPREFRDVFYSRSSSDAIQAFRQYNWFVEVLGGPSMLRGQIDTVLLPKVMAKHTHSRMTRDHAVAWLQIMKVSIQEEFPEEHKLRDHLGLYWLHFYGFFPFDDETRKEFRQLIAP